MKNTASLMTYPFSWHDGIVQHYLSSFLVDSLWDKNPRDSCKRNTYLKCNGNFPKNQFILFQSLCILGQHVRRSLTSEDFNLILTDGMNLTWVIALSRDIGYWPYPWEGVHQLFTSQRWSNCGKDQSREEQGIISDAEGWLSLLFSDQCWIESNVWSI